MDSRDRQSRIERMKREKQRQERLRLRQIAILKRCLVVGAIVGALLLLITGVWALVKPNEEKEATQQENLEVQEDNQAGETDAINPNDEANQVEPEQTNSAQSINDGPAAQKPISNLEELRHAVPGWQIDDDGWWYANSDNTYYENGWATLAGKKYFFDTNGYMQTGWAAIGGQGYFFDETGQHLAEKKANMIALTFDDGPGVHTERLLDMLKENNAKATFFMVGKSLEGDYGHLVSRIRDDGHELGNHTYSHASLMSLDEADIRAELSKVDELIAGLAPGARSELIRPPYGARDERVLETITTPAIIWSIDTNDWKSRNAGMIEEVALSAKAGDIVLMHDIHKETIDACETIIPKLIEAGYELVTIDELARANGIEMQVGRTYYSFTEEALAEMRSVHMSDDVE